MLPTSTLKHVTYRNKELLIDITHSIFLTPPLTTITMSYNLVNFTVIYSVNFAFSSLTSYSLHYLKSQDASCKHSTI